MNPFDDINKKYPTQFYGRTFVPWAMTLTIGPLAVFACILGPLFWLDIAKSANGAPGYTAGIPLTIIGFLFFLPFAADSAFHVIALQRPILKIYREGLWIRSIGTPIQLRVSIFLVITGRIIFWLAIVLFWHFITLRMFRTQTKHFRWENIEAISLGTIVGRYDKENNDFGQDNSLEQDSVSYDSESFSMPIDNVFESVQFYHHNPDVREFLPSWHNEESPFGRDAFDFDR